MGFSHCSSEEDQWRDETFNKKVSLGKNDFEVQNHHDSEVNDQIPDGDGVTNPICSDACGNA